jgi:hypothetical protein
VPWPTPLSGRGIQGTASLREICRISVKQRLDARASIQIVAVPMGKAFFIIGRWVWVSPPAGQVHITERPSPLRRYAVEDPVFSNSCLQLPRSKFMRLV